MTTPHPAELTEAERVRLRELDRQGFGQVTIAGRQLKGERSFALGAAADLRALLSTSSVRGEGDG